MAKGLQVPMRIPRMHHAPLDTRFCHMSYEDRSSGDDGLLGQLHDDALFRLPARYHALGRLGRCK